MTINTAMYRVRVITVMFICLFMWRMDARAQWVSTEPTNPPESVEDIISPYHIEDAPGGAYLVVRAGEVIDQGYFGKASLEHNLDISNTTRFNVASVSKQFTAYAIMKLQQAGKLNLDNPIQTYLPDFTGFSDQLTVRHLIHHLSGLKDDLGMLSLAGWRHEDLFLNEDVLHVFRNQHELSFTPGARYSYSNTNYSLLASIVSQITGESFASWTQATIFEPLEMNHSGFIDSPEAIVPGRVTNYEAKGETYKRKATAWHNVGPGGLFTTVEDLGTWVIHLMNDSAGNQTVLNQMSEQGTLSDGSAIDYAYGLVPGSMHGFPTIGHGGSAPGTQSSLTIFPDQDLAIIVLGNRTGDDFMAGRVAADIAAFYLADEIQAQPVDTSPSRMIMITTADLASTPEGSFPADPATYPSLAGTYRLTDGDRFKDDLLLARPLIVSADGERLLLAFGEPPGIPLAPIGEDRFRVIRMNFEVSFQRNATGEAFGLIFHITEDSIGDDPPQDLQAAKQITESLNPETFQDYAGLFYSSEIETTYRFSIGKDNQLHVFHPRHGLIPLQNLAPDEFLADTHIFTNVSFIRDANGKPSEVRLRGYSWGSSIVLRRIEE